MIQLNLVRRKVLSGMLFSLLLVTPLANASDIFQFNMKGIVNGVERNAISIKDGFYTYSPTVKVFKENGVKGYTYDIKTGDYVQLTIQVMDKKTWVDTIRYLPRPTFESK